ncbi:MAG: hypothetical protein AM325_010850 [Candidatus Thorarchaeota archaeon SMTZ1-45]|nr:MAG: hypothetical protein AM325_12430 [Candidatus Thorarchaeota archaeon SMTZ1-45]
MIFAVLGFTAAIIITDAMLKSRSEPHLLEDSGSTEHIVMSFFLLIYLFYSRIVWFVSPEIGTFMISIDYAYASIVLAFSSIALGSIFASSRLRASTDALSQRLQIDV